MGSKINEKNTNYNSSVKGDQLQPFFKILNSILIS